MRIPLATYRLQFNQHFRFQDARAIVPYLNKLGITDLYASPCFEARKGSMHGYDVTNPTSLNPELGTEQEFEDLGRERKRHGMGMLLDIVPNHMAASPENPWWTDILENGPSSPYAAFFDIDWHSGSGFLENKVLLPKLGNYYGTVLENRELKLDLTEKGFVIRYYENEFPLEPRSYGSILKLNLDALEQGRRGSPGIQALREVIADIEGLPPYTNNQFEQIEKRRHAVNDIKHGLWRLYTEMAEIKKHVDANLKAFNGKKGNPKSFDHLDRLLGDQAYRLVLWRKAGEQINYRRFFDITDLVGLRVEDPKVFEASHARILEWVKQDAVTGLRVDHIDGLHDPLEYLERLQQSLSPSGNSLGTYVVVEKILCGDEELRKEWPVSGTSGYEFLDRLHDIFLDPRGIEKLDAIYSRFIGAKTSLHEIRYERKKQVLERLFRSEMEELCRHLAQLGESDRYACDLQSDALSRALKEVTACLPVYRTYIRNFEIPKGDRRFMEQALKEARIRNPTIPGPAFDFIGRVLWLDFHDSCPQEEQDKWLRFLQHWQQLTGPVMAKGFEDTTLYNYNRLISMNDVGCDPDRRDLSVQKFHQWNQRRLKNHPHSLNATSTHDTKRSEDVRARIHVLTEMTDEWERCVTRWTKDNGKKKKIVAGRPVPDANEEYLIYQTLIGAWPLNGREIPGFRERLKAYLVKAAREAKAHTSWFEPNPAYENALVDFADRLVRSSRKDRFMLDFLKFQRKVAVYGAINSLAQVLVKIASPGVPDFYQGSELWDLSLVDPDNRRPVDFEKRVHHLEELKQKEAKDLPGLLQELLLGWEDGRIKFFLTSKVLNYRKDHPELFRQGQYLPLDSSGQNKECLFALARRKENDWALAVVPRITTRLASQGKFPLGMKVWGRGLLLLPQGAPGEWHNVLTGEILKVTRVGGKKVLPLHQVFCRFPVALFSTRTHS